VSFVVTIDGPAAAGKSSTARAIAATFGWRHLDTGAFYRALGLKGRRLGALDDPAALARIAGATTIGFAGEPATPRVILDGVDVSEAIRSPEAGDAASRLAAIPEVREVLLRWQRASAEGSPLVGEGRDLGTVVFPDADVKLFLHADVRTRARRRLAELAGRGLPLDMDQVMEELESRDRRDQTREASPLKPAADAVVLDTTGLDLEGQVAAALAVIRAHPRFPAREPSGPGSAGEPGPGCGGAEAGSRGGLGVRVSLHYSASRFLLGGLVGALSGWRVEGREHVPREGGLIVASNHVSLWDPPLVGIAAVRELHFLAKEELFRTPVLGPLIRSLNAIPIRRGVADLSGLARAMEVLRAGRALLMFPEGTRVRDGELRPARPGLGMLAVATDARIVPVFISGSQRPSRWLFRLGRLRVRFGPARTWRELAGPDADLPPGRTLYQGVGAGLMREIGALRDGQVESASRGAARPSPPSR